MKDQAWHDPVVEEIHTIRKQLAEQYRSDLLAYSQAAELHCLSLGFKFTENPSEQPSSAIQPSRQNNLSLPNQEGR